MLEAKHFYEFGTFRLDPAERLLLRDNHPVPLAPKAFETLVLLVQNSGRLLTKDELMKRLWPGTFVEEVNLAQNISAIRRALHDKNGEGRYIETVSKAGYRFIGDARRVAAGAPATDRAAGAELAYSAAPWWKSPQSMLVLPLAALIIALVGLNLARLRGRIVAINPHIQSLAVLPLENLSRDPEQEYFADGMTDELITDLAKIHALRVISRNSVMQFKGKRKSMPQIARELNVDAVVEGTVQRFGDRVRIRVQLIEGPKDRHLWAETYDRELHDILQLESDVARQIARQIGHLTSPERTQPVRQQPVPTEAHENYLKGRYRWAQRTEPGLRAGIKHFQTAIELAPSYPEPYAGLADCYIMLANWGYMPSAEAYANAESAARKALQLDDQLAEAYTSLAYATLLYEWDWVGAEQKFRRAIELDPNYATAHHFYSIYLMAAGRHPEAQSEIRRALELDPFSLIINAVAGWVYYEGRQYDQGIQQCEKTVETDPTYTPALLNLGMIYLKTQQYDKAISQFERARAVAGDTGVILSYLAQGRALSGDKTEARKILSQLEKMFVSPWDLALVHIALGDKDKALSFLEKAVDQRVGWVVRLGVDPALDSLRGDPRLITLQRRVRIPQMSTL